MKRLRHKDHVYKEYICFLTYIGTSRSVQNSSAHVTRVVTPSDPVQHDLIGLESLDRLMGGRPSLSIIFRVTPPFAAEAFERGEIFLSISRIMSSLSLA